ncbi:toxin-antitoxin system protein [Prevotella cerevisiae]|uniref:Toxin-antitoxin system protein n=1 Tax=Segatella cerevisiae TaxID=2053716 RepID=A0ABT1BXL1_9BACT|nr:toxin-antitoxin system protein [Segatella cerevisiae]MCO6025781.1 toxin-antitoxin system protein [Segatella cerevisiae]
METAMERKPASFRLNSDLLEILKKRAKACNRSLNNYVESILLDAVYKEPNDTTISAIKENRSGKYAGEIDVSSIDAFKRSLDL